VRRREFIKSIVVLGGWPNLARAQEIKKPFVGYLSQGTPEGGAQFLAAVVDGLSAAGLAEGRDFTNEPRWALNDPFRLPELAGDLVQRRVAVIVTLDTPQAEAAAKAATPDIPIVFALGTDPIQAGLVASLNRPGGNVTGISTMNLDIGGKLVGLLYELLPKAKRIAVLVNIENAGASRPMITGTQEASLTLGLPTEFVFASSSGEIETALSGLGAKAQGLIVQGDALFQQNRGKIAALAIREKLPTLSSLPGFVAAGGLMSYGSDFVEAHRYAGAYAARILKGEKPGNLPVQRADKFRFVINLKTAKTIGVNIPATLLARTDEVIE
jgi:putative ABC transport system substrate-binding protein